MSERRVVILGASGYGGGELLRLLAAHPARPQLRGITRTHAGKPFHTVHPNLRGVVQGNFDGAVDWEWLGKSPTPVLFGAMPHGELAKQYTQLMSDAGSALADRLTIVDLSADFRIQDITLSSKYYKGEHPCPGELPSFVYGLPEWQRDAIKGARRVANPGCFATALQLALLPLAGLDLKHIAIAGATGSSGSGMAASETTHHPTRANDFRAYKILKHQHEAEAIQLMRSLGIEGVLSFVPHSAPIVRGIFCTVQLLDVPNARERFEKTYAKAPFIRMVDDTPRLAAVNGSNFVDIGVVTEGRATVVMIALDNLGKGMASQAVQNMNLATGLDETDGLWTAAPYPA